MKSFQNSLLWIQLWFHYILHDPEIIHEFITIEFMYDFIIMNSSLWIHTEFMHMNSEIWFHYILHNHEFISEFVFWIHIWIHDHEFICYISWPMNSYTNSCIWRIAWNHTWNHVYQGSRWLSLQRLGTSYSLVTIVGKCQETPDDINVMPFTTLLSAQIAEW